MNEKNLIWAHIALNKGLEEIKTEVSVGVRINFKSLYFIDCNRTQILTFEVIKSGWRF